MKKITKKQILLTLALVCSIVLGGQLLSDTKKVSEIDPPGIRIMAEGAGTNGIDPPGI